MFGLRKLARFGGALVVGVWLANSAVGQQEPHSALTAVGRETRNDADLVARVAALEAQLKGGTATSNDAHGAGCGGGGDACGCGSGGCCCDPCCRSEGFYYGAELTYLQPHNSSGVGLNALSLGNI